MTRTARLRYDTRCFLLRDSCVVFGLQPREKLARLFVAVDGAHLDDLANVLGTQILPRQ